MISTILALVLWTLVPDTAAQTLSAGNLAAAKALYASGDYEEALSNLASPKPDDSPDEVDEYRSLCLLALGRTVDAQHSLESLVTRSPMFKMSEADVSPRLVTIFHDVRKRLLPTTVRDLYDKAKANFEQGHYEAAKPQFEQLMVLLADDDLAGNAAALADLKMLSDGFLKLTTAQLAAKNAAAAPPTPAPKPTPATPAENASQVVPIADRVFSIEDKEVTAPVEVSCPVPEWHPANATQLREYRGFLRIVIGIDGKVETSALVVPAHPAYDPLLLAAVKDWQFKPALREGQPVKYQKMIPIVLKPREGGTTRPASPRAR
jgi:hypothetical protein